MCLNSSRDWRLVLIQTGVLATFALIPLWYRFTVKAPPPLGFADLHVARFLILLPMLWTVGWWLATGLPGFRTFSLDRLRGVWGLLLLLLSAWAFISTTWAFQRINHPEVGLNGALQLGMAVLFAVAVACAGPSLRHVLIVLTLGLVVNSIITISQVTNQGALGLEALGEFEFAAGDPGVSILQAEGVRWVRPYGLMPHPNLLAGTLLAGLMSSAGLIVSERGGWRWLGTVAFPVGMAALLLTFSRGAWLGLAAGLVGVLPLALPLLKRPVIRRQALIVTGCVLMVGAVVGVTYRPFLAARAGVGAESIELRSVSDRLVFTEFALRSVGERPVQGVGIANFPWRTSYYLLETNYDLRGDNVHHVFLSALAELGVVGLALAAGALIAGVEAALRATKTAPYEARGARVALLGIVVAYAVVGLIDHYPWTLIHFQVVWWGSLALALKAEP